MSMPCLVVALILCSSCLVQFSVGDRVKEKIYITLSASSIKACYRRFDNKGQIGCASQRGGNVGVVHYMQSEEDYDWVLNTGPNSPYVAILDNQDFTNETMEKLTSVQGRVNGVLILGVNTTKPDRFSADQACPNNEHGMYSNSTEYRNCRKITWNRESSTSLMWRDWGMPIVNLLKSKDGYGIIHDCYKKFNEPINNTARPYPLCAAHVKSTMDGGKDTPTCIRRSQTQMNLNPVKFCDPLGDRNIFLMSKVYDNTMVVPNKSVIIAATRLDSFSMFEDIAPGADSSITGVVTLLSVIHTMAKVKKRLSEPDTKPIMFTFFHGESFDYIGSSRMIYDMEKNVFPTNNIADGETGAARIRLDNIDQMIEIQQVGMMNDGKLWMHSDPVSQKTSHIKTQVEELKRILKESESNITLESPPPGQPLPPSSIQSFLKKINIPGVVIADHQGEYTNRYYNSRFDLPSQINASYPDDLPHNESYNHVTPAVNQIHAVATSVSRALFKMATGENLTVDVDIKTVSNLLYCFLHNINCTLLQHSNSPTNARRLTSTNFNIYVGVDGHNTLFPMYVRLLTSYFYGENMTAEGQIKKKEDCKSPDTNSLYQYSWMSGPVRWNYNDNKLYSPYPFCMRSQANYSQAVSPAFIIPGYDWNSNKYSSWSESRWANNAMSVKYFLIPSATRQIVILCIGLLVFLIGGFLVFAVNRGASVVFKQETSRG